MKIKLTIFCILVFISSQVFAKDNSSNSKLEPKITSLFDEKQVLSKDEKIPPFDFKKLYDEAEAYFRASKAWMKLKCEPKSGFICTKRECPKRDIKAVLILDKKKESISRCEGKVCETFPAKFNQTGVFFNIQTEGPVGTLIRVLGDSRYKEITTVGLDAYIANGECNVVN